MGNEATARSISDLAINDYTPDDASTLPKNATPNRLKSANIINLAIKRDADKIKAFSEAIECDRTNPIAWDNRGRAFLEANDPLNAIADYTEAIKLNHILAYNDRGAAHRLLGDFTAAVADFDALIAYFDNVVTEAEEFEARGYLTKAKDFSSLNSLEHVAMTFVNKGRTLYDSGDYEGAIVVYAEMVRRFSEWLPGDKIKRQIATALLNKAFTLRHSGRPKEAIADYDTLIYGVGKRVPSEGVQARVAAALGGKAAALYDLGNHEQAIAVIDEMIGQFDDELKPQHLRDVERFQQTMPREGIAYEHLLQEMHKNNALKNAAIANGLITKGLALQQLGKHEQAIALYDGFVDQFSNAAEPAILSDVATALINTGFALSEQGRTDRAIVSYSRVIDLFNNANDPELRAALAMALKNKGVALYQIGDYQQASAFFDQVIDRFSNEAKPGVRDQVAGALVGKGELLCTLAAGELPPNKEKQAWALFERALQFSLAVYARIREQLELYLLRYYGIAKEKDNPSNGYGVPTRVISEAELREYIKEQAALLTERLSQREESPFPILSDREVKAIIAHGKKHAWDNRREQGWPYHTNAFVYVHITYRKWVNRGLTREILAWADPSLHAHLKTKISREGGLPEWLDLPSGPEARARAITDPKKRTELEVVRKFFRDAKRKRTPRPSLGD